MAKGFVLKDNLTKDTLLKVAVSGALVAAATTSPYFLHRVVKQYFKDKDKNAAQRRARRLKELEKRKLLDFKERSDGSVEIKLSHQGKELVRRYNLEDMKLKKPKQWDGKWRIVIYDIPTSKRKASSAFSAKMKSLGMYQLQRSVWVSPYDCLEEIEFLCSVFEIDSNKCVSYITATEISNASEVKKFFNL